MVMIDFINNMKGLCELIITDNNVTTNITLSEAEAIEIKNKIIRKMEL